MSGKQKLKRLSGENVEKTTKEVKEVQPNKKKNVQTKDKAGRKSNPAKKG